MNELATMKAKTGFKQTEVGMIPEDWEVEEINSITKSISSGKSKTASEFGGKFPIYGSTGIIGKSFDADYNGSNTLIARVGANAGSVYQVEGCYNVSDNTLIVELNKQINSKLFFYYLIFVNLNKLVFGSGQPLITGGQLKSLKIPLPPLQEQKAIATALSDIDALIQSLDALIAKKKAIKQGAMQELLGFDSAHPTTPRRRLAGFSGEWVEKKLGEVCEIRKGQLITSSTKVNGNIPVIAGGKSPSYYHNESNREPRTITISASGANAGYVAFHNYVIYASDCSTIEESGNYEVKYIYYLLLLMQNEIYNMQTGGAQPHIHPKDLNPINISIPSFEEQKAITKILSDMDLEIASLERKKEKYEEIKQGMMQELLTGKVRIVNVEL